MYLCLMRKKILQFIANGLIENLNMAISTDDADMFNYFLETALWYELFCLFLFNVELE